MGVFSLESLVLFCSGKFSSVVFPLSVMCVIWTESSVLLFVECPQLSFINLLCLSFWVVVLRALRTSVLLHKCYTFYFYYPSETISVLITWPFLPQNEFYFLVCLVIFPDSL